MNCFIFIFKTTFISEWTFLVLQPSSEDSCAGFWGFFFSFSWSTSSSSSSSSVKKEKKKKCVLLLLWYHRSNISWRWEHFSHRLRPSGAGRRALFVSGSSWFLIKTCQPGVTSADTTQLTRRAPSQADSRWRSRCFLLPGTFYSNCGSGVVNRDLSCETSAGHTLTSSVWR